MSTSVMPAATAAFGPARMARLDLLAGFTDEQLVDAVHCVGYFNFINRVLDGLGVDPEPAMRYGKESGGR